METPLWVLAHICNVLRIHDSKPLQMKQVKKKNIKPCYFAGSNIGQRKPHIYSAILKVNEVDERFPPVHEWHLGVGREFPPSHIIMNKPQANIQIAS